MHGHQSLLTFQEIKSLCPHLSKILTNSTQKTHYGRSTWATTMRDQMLIGHHWKTTVHHNKDYPEMFSFFLDSVLIIGQGWPGVGRNEYYWK